MKDNQRNTNGKTHTLPPIRVSAEIIAKLEYLQATSKKSLSAIIRELIENGNVEFNPYGKELIQDVAELHKKANQCTAQVRDDIQSVKKDIKQLHSYLHDNGAENEKINIFLDTAFSRLDSIEEQHTEQITLCRRTSYRKDGIYGNLGSHN